jgi:hypothetical protein
MTHWKQNFDYRFTGAYELQPNEEKTVTIAKTNKEEVASTTGEKQMCFVAYFHENSKPMVLNKTNCKTIEKLYGADIEKWIGKKITVFAALVKAFGEMVDALRIRPTIPVTVDYAAQLRACKTLDELKAAFTAVGFPQAQFENLKNEMKTKLTP